MIFPYLFWPSQVNCHPPKGLSMLASGRICIVHAPEIDSDRSVRWQSFFARGTRTNTPGRPLFPALRPAATVATSQAGQRCQTPSRQPLSTELPRLLFRSCATYAQIHREHLFGRRRKPASLPASQLRPRNGNVPAPCRHPRTPDHFARSGSLFGVRTEAHLDVHRWPGSGRFCSGSCRKSRFCCRNSGLAISRKKKRPTLAAAPAENEVHRRKLGVRPAPRDETESTSRSTPYPTGRVERPVVEVSLVIFHWKIGVLRNRWLSSRQSCDRPAHPGGRFAINHIRAFR